MREEQKGFGAVGIIIIVLVVAVLGLSGRYLVQKNSENQTNQQAETTSNLESDTQVSFANPKKGAHFETSTPEHGSTLAAVPVDVVLNFNFDLADNSTIEITKDGKDYGTGDASVDSNKLGMRRKMDFGAPDGVYTVKYNGCWPDRTCHDGHFQFAIDSGLLNTYEDKRGQAEVTIKMSQIKFQPMNIRISPGTKVTWVNDDDEQHYVNTDSHPAHSHVLDFNSKALAKDESYSFTFNSLGAYPYHCSAHAADMSGNIVVEQS
jgi:plastocyanin/methionine-rich copper-binding protein CopC